MKKVLSIVLSVMMVAGLFAALIPVASAKPATMAEPGLLIYSEDFEGEDLTGKTNTTLTGALGWKQWIDVDDDPSTSYNDGYAAGLNGRGSASIISDKDGDKAIQLKYAGTGNTSASGGIAGDSYGWGIEFVNDNRLTGGDYILEYTARIDANSKTSTGNGIGFRNNRCWGYTSSLVGSGDDKLTVNNGMTYQIHIKHNGQTDSHLKVNSTTAETGKDSASKYLTNIEGTAAEGQSDIIGLTHTFRTVVSATEGVHTYVKTADGEWAYYFGMGATPISKFAANANRIGSGVILRIAQNVTATIDDMAVYTIRDASTPVVEMVGSQNSVAEDGYCDFRLVGSVSNGENVKYAGFITSVNGGEEKKVYLKYAYASISTNYGDDALTAPDDGFFGALEVTDCPVETTFVTKFFVEYEDGSMLISEPKTLTYQ